MLEPYNKLPWKLSELYYIQSANSKPLITLSNTNLLLLPDTQYIIQSANNFLKAIELLTKINTHYNNVENYDWDEKENNIYEIIEEFLNSLK